MVCTTTDMTTGLLQVFQESFSGSKGKGLGAFLDPGPYGLLALLQALSAKEASTPIAGQSIATHAFHLSFSFEVFTKRLLGAKKEEYNWDISWERQIATHKEWSVLLSTLEGQRDQLLAAVEQKAGESAESMWTACAALAHTVHHLGMIHVKFDALKKA